MKFYTLAFCLLLSLNVFSKVTCPKSPKDSAMVERALLRLEKSFEVSVDNLSLAYFNMKYKEKCGETKTLSLEKRLKALLDKVGSKRKSCSTKINIKSVNKENRNQGQIGWCYAHSAADLLSYKLNKRVSSVYMAVNSNEIDLGQMLKRAFYQTYSVQEGGFAYDILKDMLDNVDKGICLEKDAPSYNYGMFQVDMIINYMERIYNQYDEIKESYTPFERSNDPLDYSRREYQASMDVFYKSKEYKKFVEDTYLNIFSYETLISNAFPNIDIYDFMKVIDRSSRNTFYPNLVKKTCERKKGYLKRDKLSVKTLNKYYNSKDKLVQKINDELDDNNILEFVYYASILKEPHQELEGVHSSTIVGKRFDEVTSQCEYLVQNAWGGDCQAYSKRFDCKDGRVWIKERYLKKALLEITWLENI